MSNAATDMAGPVVLSGAAVCCALGDDLDAFWARLREGRGGITRVDRFSTEGFDAHFAATIDEPSWRARFASDADLSEPDPFDVLCVRVASDAWQNAGFDHDSRIDPARVAVIVGTTAGGIASRALFERTSPKDTERWLRLMRRGAYRHGAAMIAQALGLAGPRITASTACTSSAHAIAHGRAMLSSGLVDVVLAGGADVVVEALFGGFYSLGAMSPQPCAPFSEPVGMTLGEGAAFVVMESEEHAAHRGARARVFVRGHGTSMDAYHATAADPTGAGVARALGVALRDAAIEPSRVGYVNAHGTGTEANDAAEVRGLRRALGEHVDAVPISSIKGFFGHTLGAAGALELVATLLALEHGEVPPTLQFDRPRPGAPRDPVPGPHARPCTFDTAVSLNAAFGGINAAIVLSREARVTKAPDRSPVWIKACDVLGPFEPGGFPAALQRNTPRTAPTEPRADGVAIAPRISSIEGLVVEDHARGIDPRGLDRASKAAIIVTARALHFAGTTPRGAQRDRIGLYYTADSISPETVREFWDSIEERGASRLNAAAFARSVTNAPAGAVSRALSLRGPCGVFVGRVGTPLGALAIAAEEIATRDDADHAAIVSCCLVGADELIEHVVRRPEGLPDDSAFFPGEAAAALVLSREMPTGTAPRVRIAGTGWRGPGGLAAAIDDALRHAGIARNDVGMIFVGADRDEPATNADLSAVERDFDARTPWFDPTRVFGRLAQPDAVALAAAVHALTTGQAPPVVRGDLPAKSIDVALVVATGESTGAVAVVLRVER